MNNLTPYSSTDVRASVFDTEKHSSLVRKYVNHRQKKFYTNGPRSQETFTNHRIPLANLQENLRGKHVSKFHQFRRRVYPCETY